MTYKPGWNELEFTNWKDFKRMAPSIVQLEITRISGIISSLETTDSIHNHLVKARFDLKIFLENLEKQTKRKLSESDISPLQSAIICISNIQIKQNEKIHFKMTYILNRLNDLLDKCKMVY